jgi:hypothetical protein
MFQHILLFSCAEKAWAQFKVRLWKYREMQSADFSPTLKLDDEG